MAAASAPVLLGMRVAFHLQLAPRVQELGLPVQNLAQSMLINSYTFEALQTHIHEPLHKGIVDSTHTSLSCTHHTSLSESSPACLC